jgi:hypothetical protein
MMRSPDALVACLSGAVGLSGRGLEGEPYGESPIFHWKFIAYPRAILGGLWRF